MKDKNLILIYKHVIPTSYHYNTLGTIEKLLDMLDKSFRKITKRRDGIFLHVDVSTILTISVWPI